MRHVGVSVSLLFLLAGCRTQPYVNAHIESVNNEYRELEDYVYCLEDENDRLQRELKELQKSAPGASTRPTTGSGGFRPRPATEPSPGRATPADSPPTIELPGSSSSSLPRGRSSQRPLLSPAPGETSPADTPPNITLPPLGTPASATGAAQTSATLPADTKVTRLFLNPLHTSGVDLDGRPGDDGLRVLLEPRNISDEFVPAAGSLSIVLLDPTLEGESARLARWDFDAPAVKALYEAAGQPGLKLELPWPAAPPASSRLKLFVRYETADGRLQADREIFVSPPGQSLSRWTPRSTSGPQDKAEPIAPASWSPNRQR